MDLRKYDGKKIRIRPSSIDGFFSCSAQWADIFIGGLESPTGSRAAIGTAIHAGAETFWTDAMISRKKDFNLSKIQDACMISFHEEERKGIKWGKGDTLASCEKEIKAGILVYLNDIAPNVDIPIAVEKRFTVDIDHPMVADISGTIDYLGIVSIDDIKTSKRKIVANSHTTQQSIYRWLVESSGITIEESRIQGIVLTKTPYYQILELNPNIDRAKHLVNIMLDTLQEFYEGGNPEVLFRGNTKHQYCSRMFCASFDSCDYISEACPF